MKGAIITSDYVSTVSPNYAKELRHDFFAFGLANIMSSVSNKMSGIINGIDYDYFSPELGGDIYKKYTARTLKSGKKANKLALQAELGLEVDEKIPLVVMITRLASQKGIDLLLRILDELLVENMQFVILGTGEKEYEETLKSIESRHPNMKALIKFDRVISKKLYASADLFLMPSKSEPCGLAQMICCSYGTIPVVRAVGGLYDSIIPYGAENSNGFVFENYNAHELLFCVKKALMIYNDTAEWDKLVKRAKKSDFTWKASAIKYIELYNKL
jgi:starch synthase